MPHPYARVDRTVKASDMELIVIDTALQTAIDKTREVAEIFRNAPDKYGERIAEEQEERIAVMEDFAAQLRAMWDSRT